jgi:hypothetical protein
MYTRYVIQHGRGLLNFFKKANPDSRGRSVGQGRENISAGPDQVWEGGLMYS